MIFWSPTEYEADRSADWLVEHDDSRAAWEDAGRPDTAYWSTADHSANYALAAELQAEAPAPAKKRGRPVKGMRS